MSGVCTAFHECQKCVCHVLLALAVYPDSGVQSHSQSCLACAVCYAASFLRLLPDSPPTPRSTVHQFPRVCTETEFACHSYNECVALEYRCDRRPDCRDMSDELNCGEELLGTSKGPWWPA